MRKLPRAWDKVTKEMMLPARWEEDYVGCGHKKIGLYIYRSRKNMVDHSSLDWVLRHPEHFDVMWPAGIKDKNNKEIYEGDIIRWEDTTGGEPEYGFEKHTFQEVVEFQQGAYQTLSTMWGLVNFEVIGNIHENPELLEK